MHTNHKLLFDQFKHLCDGELESTWKIIDALLKEYEKAAIKLSKVVSQRARNEAIEMRDTYKIALLRLFRHAHQRGEDKVRYSQSSVIFQWKKGSYRRSTCRKEFPRMGVSLVSGSTHKEISANPSGVLPAKKWKPETEKATPMFVPFLKRQQPEKPRRYLAPSSLQL